MFWKMILTTVLGCNACLMIICYSQTHFKGGQSDSSSHTTAFEKWWMKDNWLKISLFAHHSLTRTGREPSNQIQCLRYCGFPLRRLSEASHRKNSFTKIILTFCACLHYCHFRILELSFN